MNQWPEPIEQNKVKAAFVWLRVGRWSFGHGQTIDEFWCIRLSFGLNVYYITFGHFVRKV
jgi:hypothetical protein